MIFKNYAGLKFEYITAFLILLNYFAIGKVIDDHNHMVVLVPPKYQISEVVGFLKGKSAIKVFNLHTELKKRYWGRHFQARGYCVSTVGLDEEQIRKYVKWQLHKDKRMDQLELWDK